MKRDRNFRNIIKCALSKESFWECEVKCHRRQVQFCKKVQKMDEAQLKETIKLHDLLYDSRQKVGAIIPRINASSSRPLVW